jgi:hypothetical protein
MRASAASVDVGGIGTRDASLETSCRRHPRRATPPACESASLRTMRSAEQLQFGVHLVADYGSKRSNSDRLAGICLTNFLGAGRFNPTRKHPDHSEADVSRPFITSETQHSGSSRNTARTPSRSQAPRTTTPQFEEVIARDSGPQPSLAVWPSPSNRWASRFCTGGRHRAV